MTVRRQWALVVVIVAALGGGVAAAQRFLGDSIVPVRVGVEAPPFTARTLDTPPREKRLADYAGQVVLLNLWATYCVPCRREMPSIEALHRAYGSKGLHVVAVSIDDPGSENAIRAFRDEFGLTFEILHDHSGTMQQKYQMQGIPETFIIGRDGRIRKMVIGATDWNTGPVHALMARMLGTPNDSASAPAASAPAP
jgi:cytochrome c biogenesis protein CcmG/thiol:disulfide interchange protein DsbE